MLSRYISHPLELIDEIWQNSNKNKENKLEQEAFDSALKDPQFYSQIPRLNTTTNINLANASLCSYRGIVQHTLGMEMYLCMYKETCVATGQSRFVTSKYKEEMIPSSSEYVITPMDDSLYYQDPAYAHDRLPLVCGPVPGENSWVDAYCKSNLALPSYSKFENSKLANSNTLKRPAEEEEQIKMSDINAKRLTIERREGDEVVGYIPPVVSSVPTTQTNSGGCLIKMYNVDFESYRINDVLEYIGVYFSSRQHVICSQDDMQLGAGGADEMDIFDYFTTDASTLFSHLPTLHCIVSRRLGSSFPLLLPLTFKDGRNPFTFQSNVTGGGGVWAGRDSDVPPFSPPSPAECTRLRSLLKEVLKVCLQGDDLSAEYVLLSILCRVYGQRVAASPLGYLGVNISGLPAHHPVDAMLVQLVATLREVVPCSVAYDVSVDDRFTSRCDANTGLFSPSSLQLAEGTLLCLDERRLSTRNPPHSKETIATLTSVIERLALPMTSEYCSVDIPLDLCVLVFSAQESVLSPQVVCPWQPEVSSAVSGRVDHSSLLEQFRASLPALRMWWASARYAQVAMTPETVHLAENDFVNARQVDSRLTPDDFHVWLSLARLITVSHGENSINPAHWAAMRAIERKRVNRRMPRRDREGNYSGFHDISVSPNTVVI